MLPVPILEIEDKSDYIKCDSTGNDADDDAEREERADYNPQRRKEMDPIDTTVTIAGTWKNIQDIRESAPGSGKREEEPNAKRYVPRH